MCHKLIEFGIGPDVEPLEVAEERRQVLDRRIAEDFQFAIGGPGQSFGEMVHQPGEFIEKGLLDERHCILETLLHPLAFVLMERGIQSSQIVRGFNRREFPRDGKFADQRFGIIPDENSSILE